MESFKVKENQLRDRLKALEAEKQKILHELVVLENQKKSKSRPASDLKGVKALNRPPETNDEKVKLFLDLFRCRQDVFPKYWENSKNGKKGYSPVCLNEWQRPLCDKPKIKCSDCKNQKFARLDSHAVENHLRGLQIIGTYSILENDSCTFLACDFDEESWQRDVFLYKEQAALLGVETLVERSRSGNGAHAWIFFSEAIPARLARSLGTLILSKCIEANHNISLKSYDRFFPNQDCLPEGGFGNLIALPLQRLAREKGNSLFINDDLIPFADQWKERLESFLDLEEGVVGIYTGTKKKLKGQIDIAMLPSLSKFEELDEVVEKYGQVIIDEVHHIPAASFEGVLKRFKAKYVTGLSATPYRKDGLDRIIFQQCGPIRFKMDSPDGGLLLKTVFIKETGFKLPAEVGENPAYTVFSDLIAANENRNELIASDLVTAVNQGRFPLVISDRKEQLTKIQELFLLKESQSDRQVFRLDGELSSKQRKEVLKQVAEARVGGDVAVIFATASLIGEGFDLPELDTLILASPLSFEGRLVQYAGRLHRIADGKTGIEIYDYVESACGVSYKMYKNRIRTYKKMEYQISAPMMGSSRLIVEC